ncbi:MAG: hypothetical protein DRI97_18365 [Bacteroidetes bacterium]|nr:MAG: hypothetical protein DRI97_18365 [Bacteroidota bacterium]
MAKRQHSDDGSDEMILKPDLSITFKNKASIKRSEETGILLEDEKAIAIVEGDAVMEDASNSLSETFVKTKLQPDTAVIYPDPTSLKKRVAIIPAYTRYAAAAVILLLISIGILQVFSPDATQVRMAYELVKLESISIQLAETGTQSVNMNYRKTESMPMAFPGREMVRIERITGTSPDHITSSSTLATNNILLYSRPSILPQTVVGQNEVEEANNQNLALNAQPKERTLIGKVFSGLFGKARAPFENNSASTEEGSESGFSIWNLAELGMKGVNAMGDHDYTVVRDYNKKGNVKGLIVLEE